MLCRKDFKSTPTLSQIINNRQKVDKEQTEVEQISTVKKKDPGKYKKILIRVVLAAGQRRTNGEECLWMRD
jgi:sulfatase maturation enzyme AslB (radical SAM superfamily)